MASSCMQVSAGINVSSFALLAELENQSVTAVHSWGSSSSQNTKDKICLGTAQGMVAVLQQHGDSWELGGCHQLDGRVMQLRVQPDDGSVVLAASDAVRLQ